MQISKRMILAVNFNIIVRVMGYFNKMLVRLTLNWFLPGFTWFYLIFTWFYLIFSWFDLVLTWFDLLSVWLTWFFYSLAGDGGAQRLSSPY